MLATYRFGPETGVPLVIVHGLYGSARNWGVIAKRMAEARPVITVDLRNHGQSFWADSHTYADLAGDLAEVIAAEGQVDLLGHSMGGKAAMVAALGGAAIRRLIIADIAPVGYTHSQVQHIQAMQALDLETINTRAEADAALAQSTPDPALRAFFLQSLVVREKRWLLNLDVLGRKMPGIMGFPEVTGAFHGPTLFLSGAASDYVQPEHRDKIKDLFPNARFAKIPEAGHWLHAERPRAFQAAVEAFLDA